MTYEPRARVRRSDPETAKAAAASLEREMLGRLDQRILDHLESFGPRTSREVADAIDVDRQSVSPRFVHLVEAGLVAEDGKRENPSGRRAIAWKRTYSDARVVEKRVPDSKLLDRLYALVRDHVCDACWAKIPKKTRRRLRRRAERRGMLS